MINCEIEWIINVCWILLVVGNVCLVILFFRFLLANKRIECLVSEIDQAQEFYKPYYDKMRNFLGELNWQRYKFGELECSFQEFSKKYLKVIEKSDEYKKLLEKINKVGITETKRLKEKGIFFIRRNRKVFRKEFVTKNEKFYDPEYTNKKKYLFLNFTKDDLALFIKGLSCVLMGTFILLNVTSGQFSPYFHKYYWKILIVCIIIVGGLFIYENTIIGLVIGLIWAIYKKDILGLLSGAMYVLFPSMLILLGIYTWMEWADVLAVLKNVFSLQYLCLSSLNVGVFVCLIPNAFFSIKLILLQTNEDRDILITLRNEEKRNNVKDMLDEELCNWIDFITDNIEDLKCRIKKYNYRTYKKKLVEEEQNEVIQIYGDYLVLKKVLEQEVADDFETGFKKIKELQKESMED